VRDAENRDLKAVRHFRVGSDAKVGAVLMTGAGRMATSTVDITMVN
jgi:hypothetical protein